MTTFTMSRRFSPPDDRCIHFRIKVVRYYLRHAEGVEDPVLNSKVFDLARIEGYLTGRDMAIEDGADLDYDEKDSEPWIALLDADEEQKIRLKTTRRIIRRDYSVAKAVKLLSKLEGSLQGIREGYVDVQSAFPGFVSEQAAKPV